jgi:hypothetical protein
MKDLLIPLGLVVFIALFAFAIIHTARKQRKAKARAFRDFADRHGLSYLGEDDGSAQAFAEGFDGIGRFSSPSLGNVIPQDVVRGEMNGVKVILFRHSIRYSEGWAREWFVAGVTCAEAIAKRCAIQLLGGKPGQSSMYLQDPVVKEQRAGAFNLAVRAASQAHAGKIIDANVLNRISGLSGELPLRPEIQVRGNRVAAYPADRNATIDDVETLERLLVFTQSVSKIAAITP